MGDKVTKHIQFDTEVLDFIQRTYGNVAPSVLIDLLLTSLMETLKENKISMPEIYKKSAHLADEKLRRLNE